MVIKLIVFSMVTALLLCSIPVHFFWNDVSRYDNVYPHHQVAKACVVLGAAIWGDEPSTALKERLDQAYDLYKKRQVEKIFVSGGLGNGQITEAEGMAKYLLKKGVSQEVLILENKSTNTKENIEYTARILKQHKISNVYIVTHDYHMSRALLYAKKVGMSAFWAPVHSKTLFMPYHKIRECLALFKLKYMTGK